MNPDRASPRRGIGARFGAVLIASFATLVAVAVRWLLDPWLGEHLPLVTLFGAVAVAVWAGGTRPALLSMVAGYVACDLLFIAPRGFTLDLDAASAIGAIAYLASCAVIIGFGTGLRRTRELHRTTLASIGDGVIATDLGGRIASMNGVAESLTGWTQREARGKELDTVFRIVDEDTGEPVPSPARRALSEGVIVGLANHTLLISRDGSRQPIDDSAAPIRDAAGSVVGCVLVFRGVAERRAGERRLESSERELRDFFDSATVGLHQVGPDGIILRANRAELELLGYPREEYEGRPVSDFHVDSEVIAEIMRRLRAGEILSDFPARLRCRDGSIKHVRISSNVMWEDGHFIHTRCFTRDVTEQMTAEQARLAAEALSSERLNELQTIYDTTPVGMCLLDRDLRYVRINARLAEMNGLPASEHIGQSVRAMVPELAQKVEPLFHEVLSTGAIVNDLELSGQTKAQPGVERTWLESYGPQRNAAGEVVGIIVTAVEISDRKRAEAGLKRSEELFRGLGEAVPALVWMADAEGQPIYQNPAWRDYTGITPLGPVADLFASNHPDDAQGLRLAWERGRSRAEPLHFEVRVRRRDGVYRWFIARTVPIKDERGEVLRWLTVMTDIDDLKRAEAALREADRRKDEFLATLAHELRNPLAPLRNSVEILKRAQEDESLYRRSLDMLERQLAQMERLTDDLLDISRITQSRLELRTEPVQLASVLQNAVESCRPLIEMSGHELQLALPDSAIFVEGDAARLTQIFGNLLNNACKYTPRGGKIAIATTLSADEVAISVSDNGSGISPLMLSRIFDMFAQSQRTLDRAQGGLGIGLTLAKRLVTLHGGSIEAHSPGPGRGSEFIVRLPSRRAPDRPAAARRREMAQVRRRILVVDDNRDSAESLATLLGLFGHETRVAYDGLAALEEAERFRPHLLLLDIGLPELDGYAVCRRIRASEWGSGITLVALTGWGQPGDRRRSAEVGFDAHLVKPIDRDVLMQVLASLGASADS